MSQPYCAALNWCKVTVTVSVYSWDFFLPDTFALDFMPGQVLTWLLTSNAILSQAYSVLQNHTALPAYPIWVRAVCLGNKSQELQIWEWSVQNCGPTLPTGRLMAFIHEPGCGLLYPSAVLAFSKYWSLWRLFLLGENLCKERQYFSDLIVFINRNHT